MAYIFPNEADSFALSAALAKGNMTLRIIAPGNATGFPALTATMTTASFLYLTAGGYADKTVNVSAWCVPFLSAGSAAASASGNASNGGFQFAFTAAPMQSASGYVLETSTNKLFLAEYFTDGPYILTNAGDTITITPVVKST